MIENDRGFRNITWIKLRRLTRSFHYHAYCFYKFLDKLSKIISLGHPIPRVVLTYDTSIILHLLIYLRFPYRVISVTTQRIQNYSKMWYCVEVVLKNLTG